MKNKLIFCFVFFVSSFFNLLSADNFNIQVNQLQVDQRFALHLIDISLNINCNLKIGQAKFKEEAVEFITNYKDKAAYWEKLNKDFLVHLITRYPSITRASSKIAVHASPSKPHHRWSEVCYESAMFKEKFGFEMKLETPSIEKVVLVSWEYKFDIKPDEYPNFFKIKEDILKFASNHPQIVQKPEFLQQCIEDLMQLYPVMVGIKLEFQDKVAIPSALKFNMPVVEAL